MAYQIYVGPEKKPLELNTDDVTLVSATLSLADNEAGELVFQIAPTHPFIDEIENRVSVIYVYQDDDEIWRGTPIDITTSFFGVKTVTCSGELNYLTESIQPPDEYHINEPGALGVRMFLEDIIAIHNSATTAGDTHKRFTVGAVSVSNPDNVLYRYTNWESTLQVISEKLIDRLGGHIRIRHEMVNGTEVNYIDYLQDYPRISDQKIQFGHNLLDYATDYPMEDVATRIIPLGARLDDSPIEALDAYLTIESVNDGKNYLQNDTAAAKYGVITKVVHWDDVTVASNLKTKGQAYLNNEIYDNLVLTVNAVDAANMCVRDRIPVFDASVLDDTVSGLNGTVSNDTLTVECGWVEIDRPASGVDGLRLLDKVRCISEPHNLDALFPISKMDLDLKNPANTTLTLGIATRMTLTQASRSLASAVRLAIEELPKKHNIIEEAVENATALIISGALGSHVVVKPDEIYVMDTDDPSTAVRVWRWNVNGLGYSSTGVNGPYGLAMTIDGAIVADYVTAGTMSAERVRGGILEDINGNTTFNLTTGELTTKNLTISADGLKEKIQYQWVYDIINVSGNFSWSYKPAITNTYYNGTTVLGNDAYFVGSYGLAESHLTTQNIHQKIYGVRLNKADLNTSGTPTAGYVQVERLGSYSSSDTMTYVTGCYNIQSPNTPEFYTYLSKTYFRYGGYDGYSSYIYVDKDSGINIRCGDGSNRVATIEVSKSSGTFEVYLHSRSLNPLLHISVSTTGSLYYAKILTQNIQLSGSSSLRYKHNIDELGEDLDPHKLLKLKPKQFVFNEDHPTQYQDMAGQTLPGFIAEEVAEIYPAAVIHDNVTGEIENWDERRIIPGMLALIQEQQKRIDQLEARLARLEKLVEVDP